MEFLEENVDGGLLEGSGEVGALLSGEERGEFVGGEGEKLI